MFRKTSSERVKKGYLTPVWLDAHRKGVFPSHLLSGIFPIIVYPVISGWRWLKVLYPKCQALQVQAAATLHLAPLHLAPERPDQDSGFLSYMTIAIETFFLSCYPDWEVWFCTKCYYKKWVNQRVTLIALVKWVSYSETLELQRRLITTLPPQNDGQW